MAGFVADVDEAAGDGVEEGVVGADALDIALVAAGDLVAAGSLGNARVLEDGFTFVLALILPAAAAGGVLRSFEEGFRG